MLLAFSSAADRSRARFAMPMWSSLGRKQDFNIGFCRPPNIAATAKIIQIDPSPFEIGRNRGVAVGMVGDVTGVLEQMTREAANHSWRRNSPWLEELRAARAAQLSGMKV